MSNRTSEANKAVTAAWENEKSLVLEGKGTRNWSPAQQNDILSRGKAYDEDGKAFEGHHMKSVEAYPEHQGDVENIQLLSHAEHILAHGSYTGNPTNGFFNPVTRETKDFGTDSIEPCRVINLTKPITKNNDVAIAKNTETDNTVINEPKVKNICANDGSPYKPPKYRFSTGIKRFAADYLGIVTTADAIRFAIKAIETLGPIFISAYKMHKVASKHDNSSKSLDFIVSDITENKTERSSPTKHIVPEHGQHYNTRNGRIWKEKAPYPRGR